MGMDMTQNSADPRLLEILVDPLSKVPLRYDGAKQELVCDSGRRAYPIRDGIPVMMVSEAKLITEDEVKK